MRDGPIRVGVAVFPESDPSIVFGVFDTLWAAGHLWDALHGLPPRAPLFAPRLVGRRAGPLELVTGVSVVVQDALDAVADPDVVFVPNVLVTSAAGLRALDRELLGWIRAVFERGEAQIFAACGGPLVLAEAGLLDGREATTHWGYAKLFREAFPEVALFADRILVQTGPGQRIVCSGGASSWQDLALFLVARHAGCEEAVRLSKLFLYQWHRDGQLPFAAMTRNTGHEDLAVREQQLWAAEHYDLPNPTAEMVRRSGLPERTFTRRFRAATGYSPLGYVQALRVEEAKQMLETGDLPVDRVGREVGYEDTASFRRVFKRLTALTPAAYRRKLQVPGHLRRGLMRALALVAAWPVGGAAALEAVWGAWAR